MENRRSHNLVITSPSNLRFLTEVQEFQESKRTSDRNCFIAPNRQTIPLPLAQHQEALLQTNPQQSQPVFDSLDLRGMFANRKASLSQIEELRKPKNLLFFDPFQTPPKTSEHPAMPGLRRVTLLQGGSQLDQLPHKKTRPKEKGLRKLSHRAYEIVISMKSASYKEVANRLVAQMNKQRQLDKEGKEEQNIKRRVYDALNVLIALGVLRKDGRKIIADRKKLPRLMDQPQDLQEQIQAQQQTIEYKRKCLQDLQQFSLAARDFLTEKSQPKSLEGKQLSLPFFYLQLAQCQYEGDQEKVEFQGFGQNPQPVQVDLEWICRNLKVAKPLKE